MNLRCLAVPDHGPLFLPRYLRPGALGAAGLATLTRRASYRGGRKSRAAARRIRVYRRSMRMSRTGRSMLLALACLGVGALSYGMLGRQAA